MSLSLASAMERVFVGPDWRFQIAMSARTSCDRLRPWPDDLTRRAAGFFKLQARHGLERASQRYPDIGAAEMVWGNSAQSDLLKLLAIGGCEPAEIAERFDLGENVIVCLESLRFDVRAFLSAPTWIVLNVIATESDRGRVDFAAKLRVAFFGGRHAARALVDGNLGMPVASAERLASATMLMNARMIEAAAVPLDEAGSLAVLRLANEMHLEEQRIDLERAKLSARMQRWDEHRVLAEARIDLELKRLANRTDDGGQAEPRVIAVSPSTIAAA